VTDIIIITDKYIDFFDEKCIIFGKDPLSDRVKIRNIIKEKDKNGKAKRRVIGTTIRMCRRDGR
jgi:hypothetical protein